MAHVVHDGDEQQRQLVTPNSTDDESVVSPRRLHSSRAEGQKRTRTVAFSATDSDDDSSDASGSESIPIPALTASGSTRGPFSSPAHLALSTTTSRFPQASILIDHPPAEPPPLFLTSKRRVANPAYAPARSAGYIFGSAAPVDITIIEKTNKRLRTQALRPCDIARVTAASTTSKTVPVQERAREKRVQRYRRKKGVSESRAELLEYWSCLAHEDDDDYDATTAVPVELSYEERFDPSRLPISLDISSRTASLRKLEKTDKRWYAPDWERKWEYQGLDLGARGAADKGTADTLWAVPDYRERAVSLAHSTSMTSPIILSSPHHHHHHLHYGRLLRPRYSITRDLTVVPSDTEPISD